MKQITKFLTNIWPSIKDLVIAQLKTAFVKAFVKRIFGTVAGAGFLGWLGQFLAEEFFDDILKPILTASFTFMGYTFRKVEGGILVERIVKAQEENNAQDYNDAVDDIYS